VDAYFELKEQADDTGEGGDRTGNEYPLGFVAGRASQQVGEAERMEWASLKPTMRRKIPPNRKPRPSVYS